MIRSPGRPSPRRPDRGRSGGGWAAPWTRRTSPANCERYPAAGLGGVQIIPIYGAKGWEDKYITYLSPEWMDMMGWTVGEAHRLGMGVDMTLGTGWCFGGPTVTRSRCERQRRRENLRTRSRAKN